MGKMQLKPGYDQSTHWQHMTRGPEPVAEPSQPGPGCLKRKNKQPQKKGNAIFYVSILSIMYILC